MKHPVHSEWTSYGGITGDIKPQWQVQLVLLLLFPENLTTLHLSEWFILIEGLVYCYAQIRSL